MRIFCNSSVDPRPRSLTVQLSGCMGWGSGWQMTKNNTHTHRSRAEREVFLFSFICVGNSLEMYWTTHISAMQQKFSMQTGVSAENWLLYVYVSGIWAFKKTVFNKLTGSNSSARCKKIHRSTIWKYGKSGTEKLKSADDKVLFYSVRCLREKQQSNCCYFSFYARSRVIVCASSLRCYLQRLLPFLSWYPAVMCWPSFSSFIPILLPTLSLHLYTHPSPSSIFQRSLLFFRTIHRQAQQPCFAFFF